MSNISSYDELNGSAWRTKFNPALTYNLSTGDDLFSPYYNEFGSGYVPHNVIIGGDYKIIFTDSGFDYDEFVDLIDLALSTYFDIYVENPIDDIELTGGESTEIDISNVFALHEGSGDIVTSISYNSNPALVTATLTGSIISITTESSVGKAIITVSAECDGEVITDQFEVSIQDNNAVELFVESFEDGNSVNGQPTGWQHLYFAPYNYPPFWCSKTNNPGQGTAPHYGQWYMFMDNSYSSNPEHRAEGWMCKSFNLEAEKHYRLTFWAMADKASEQYIIKASYGTSADKDAMINPIIAAEDVVIGINEHSENAGEFTVPTTGTYYIGIYGYQNGEKEKSKYMSIDDITLYDVTTSMSKDNKIADFNLHQNYPNPFNPETTISFNLNKESLTKLSVFNTKGEEIASLVNSNLAAGIHTINFNAQNLNSGLYYYSLETSSGKITKKMLFVK